MNNRDRPSQVEIGSSDSYHIKIQIYGGEFKVIKRSSDVSAIRSGKVDRRSRTEHEKKRAEMTTGFGGW